MNYPVWIAQLEFAAALACGLYVAAGAVLRLAGVARRAYGRVRFCTGRPVRFVRAGWQS